MRSKLPKYVCLISLALVGALGLEGKTVQVKGHYRKNGTYVRPHVRNVGGGSSCTYSPTSSSHYKRSYSRRRFLPSAGSSTEPVKEDATRQGVVPTAVGGVEAEARDSGLETPHEACRAIYDTGRRCNRWTENGQSYCSLHQLYDPGNRPRWVQIGASQSGLIEKTAEQLDAIRKAIDYFSDRRNGELPPSEEQLRVLVPAHMAPPSQDAWKRAFCYTMNDEGLDVRSAGPDAEYGSADDLVLIMEK